MEKFIKEVFTQEEIDIIESCIAEQVATREVVEWDDSVDGEHVFQGKIVKLQKDLGRYGAEGIVFPKEIYDKVSSIVNSGLANNMYKLTNQGEFYVEYNPKYGTPALLPHYDSGTCTLILDYQLSSTTDWPLGIDDKLYQLKDNEGIILKPLDYLHYRPVREWSDGDSVRMIFFNFINTLDIEHKNRINDIYAGASAPINTSDGVIDEV